MRAGREVSTSWPVLPVAKKGDRTVFPNPLGPFYSFQTIALIVCAALYAKAADVEDESPVLWGGLSAGIYLATWCWLGWGFWANLGGQAGLLVAIAAYRVARDRGRTP